MNKNKLFQFLLALFVAIIFISSYISLTNYNTQQTTTTTIRTVVAVGIGNAILTGYGGPIYFNITSTNPILRSDEANVINSNLTVLELNNSLIGPSGSQYNISAAPENMSTYSIYRFVESRLNVSMRNYTRVYSTAYFQLPPYINFSIGLSGSQIISLPILHRNQSVYPFSMARQVGALYQVKVFANMILNKSSLTGSTSGGLYITVLK